ncbi:unnamed protein product [Eruca vesicaria subsp. sativa]|uniref:Uncharacterized protein n=1 Tax=Eruca vesicaria subsp. sativa TaxID=29727 RepID=A0ABC8J081_ERUVS|nr:unnamed protein product [Eruca vesicaria subsp. sativa]
MEAWSNTETLILGQQATYVSPAAKPEPYLGTGDRYFTLGSSSSSSSSNGMGYLVPVMMNQALESSPWSDQPYDSIREKKIELPTVPMETQQQQHEDIITNSAAQLHLEAQDNVPLINQTMEAQATDLPVNQGIDESH